MPSLLDRAWRNASLPGTYVSSTLAARRHRDEYAAVEAFCMFVGYPRSGHSLVGSLIDAHPDAVIAHELDVLRYLRVGFTRVQLFAMILESSAQDAAHGRREGEYAYDVPGQWQGRHRRLRVIGDKKGGMTTRRLIARPALLDRLRRTVGVPLRFVHVTRNPFDNVTTMHEGKGRGTLDDALTDYLSLCAGVADHTSRVGDDEMLHLRYEDLVADPVAALRRLCAFLGLEHDEAHLRASAAVVFPSPRRSRERGDWTPERIARLAQGMERHPFLAGYTFDG